MLAFTWFVVFLCLVRGIKSSGKVRDFVFSNINLKFMICYNMIKTSQLDHHESLFYLVRGIISSGKVSVKGTSHFHSGQSSLYLVSLICFERYFLVLQKITIFVNRITF